MFSFKVKIKVSWDMFLEQTEEKKLAFAFLV